MHTGENVLESPGKTHFFGTELGKLKRVTTDGGANICGSKNSLVGRICKEVMKVGTETPITFHCFIH
jgi:hypothetical protein